MTQEVFHVAITRFSIRMHAEEGFRGRSKDWLFNEDRLVKKLALFEHVCFSSISKGSEQPDLLLVLIDRELPKTIRHRLEHIIEPFSWAQTFELEPGALANMRDIGTLLGNFGIKSDFILTTNLDDDDALGVDYIQNLKTHVKQHQIQHPNQPFHWFGSIDMLEWDILPSKDAPRGFLKPYSGGVLFTLSTGFSVLTKNDPNGPNVFSLSHSRCLDFLTIKHRRKNYDRNGRFKFRVRLAFRALKMGSWSTILAIGSGQDFATRLDERRIGEFQGLIINHGDNLQAGRLQSGAQKRVPLDPQEILVRFNVQAQKALEKF
jgi:hypothetical protein